MKPFLEVEKNRVAYHKASNKNTVHRSSLIVPRFEQATSNIAFLNHFLIKRNNKNITLKVTAIDSKGNQSDSISVAVDEPIVYSFCLENLFENKDGITQYLIEFYSDRNLFIPFPAVMVNHIGTDFTNSVHSFNRVLNDIFENDAVNKTQVYEASIDVTTQPGHDTFFNFVTGPFPVKDDLKLSVVNSDYEATKDLSIDMVRLSNKNFYISDFLGESFRKSEERLTLKILQPKQDLFYGRLLSGIINKSTLAFSANHSFYDNSSTNEYFENQVSARTYPYFSECLNHVTFYPLMSPSLLSIHIELYENGSIFKSEAKLIKSPSNSSLTFDIDEIVLNSGFINTNLFKVVASSIDGNIPTRVSHQLIYGAKDSKSKLHSYINVSLVNDAMFTPTYKTGLTWGQVLVDTNYDSYLGIRFDKTTGDGEEVSVDFYGKSGLLKTLTKELKPNISLIFDTEFFRDFNIEHEFVWYVAKSTRPDLRADSFHIHSQSHNSSGEHSF